MDDCRVLLKDKTNDEGSGSSSCGTDTFYWVAQDGIVVGSSNAGIQFETGEGECEFDEEG